jgi:hypothetical protein
VLPDTYGQVSTDWERQAGGVHPTHREPRPTERLELRYTGSSAGSVQRLCFARTDSGGGHTGLERLTAIAGFRHHRRDRPSSSGCYSHADRGSFQVKDNTS